MKKAVVTGGAGFIGINLCLSLQKQGYTVVAIDNHSTSPISNAQLLLQNNIQYFKHDIIYPFSKEVLNAVKGTEVIYHLACPTGVPNLVPLAEEMLLTCSIGTRNVLELTKQLRAKFLLASSSEVYGNPIVSPQNEQYSGNVSPTGIRSSYEEGKRFSESLVAMYVRKYNLQATIVRIFNTYGPHMTLKDTRVIPHYIHLLLQNKPLEIYGTGEQKRTFCYVDDLVNGLQMVSNTGKAGEAYNIGSIEQITIADLAQLMLQLCGKVSKIEYKERPEHDHESRLPDLAKISKLGWQPKITLKEGLQWTMRSYGL